MKPFEIFRSGKHTSNQGAELTFGDQEISDIAGGYDTALHHAPIVVGHPKQDAPAYGWVDGLSIKNGRLVAKPGKIDPAFADLVRDGKFTARSAAFYQPSSPNNPTPGRYYLRHVGFLGAAAPAVKGLKPVEFADGEMVIEFDDIEFDDWRTGWSIDTAARLFRGLRDWIIESKDIETAERVLPEWEVDQLVTTAADMRADQRASAERTFSDQQDTAPMKTTSSAELDAREKKIAAREAEFSERESQARAAEDASFVAAIVKAGRLPIGLQAQTTALFTDLGDGEMTFADGDGEKKTTPRAAFRDLLEKLPAPVVTQEIANGENGPDFSDPIVVAASIAAEIRSAADRGETIDPATAAMRLSKG